MENGSRSKINDLLVYLAICIALVVFILASFPSFGIQITQSQILLMIIILVLLIFRHFTRIEIPGFLKLSKEVDQIKKENEEIKSTLNSIATSQSNASANVNINQFMAEQAKEAKEIEKRLPTVVAPQQQVETSRLDLVSLEEQLDGGQLIAVFAVIRNTIETMLSDIIRTKGKQVEHPSLGQLASTALQLEVIDQSIYDAINIIRNSANLIMHSHPNETAISIKEARSIFDLATKTIAELQKIYEQNTRTLEK
jgi:hypothetical protein